MRRAILKLKDVNLRQSQTHKLRGFVGNLFEKYDLIHNHDVNSGKILYRYPLIQFKVINKMPYIVALTEKAVDVFAEIFMKLELIDIEGIKIPVNEKELDVKNVEFGVSDKLIKYEFLNSWIALNQENYPKYKKLESQKAKKQKLNTALVGNILSMSKYLDYHVDEKITADVELRIGSVNLKTKSMIGFKGTFETNFHIPDFAGIGKSVSRGFGVVRRIG